MAGGVLSSGRRFRCLQSVAHGADRSVGNAGNRDVQRSTHRRGVRGLERPGGEPKAFERAVGNVLVLAKLGHIDLTSLSQAPREQADRAVDAVVERLDRGRTEPVSSVVMPQLVVRGTTATPAGP
jgi:hypothetical protein